MTTVPDLRSRFSHNGTNDASLKTQQAQAQAQASAAKHAALRGAVSAFPTKSPKPPSKPSVPPPPGVGSTLEPHPTVSGTHPNASNNHTKARAAAAAASSTTTSSRQAPQPPPPKKARPQMLGSTASFTAAAHAQNKSQESLGNRTPGTPASEHGGEGGKVGGGGGSSAQAGARGAQISPTTPRHRDFSRPPSPSASHTAAALASASARVTPHQSRYSSRPASPSHTAAALASARYTPQREQQTPASKPKPIPAWFYDRDVPFDENSDKDDAIQDRKRERTMKAEEKEAGEILPVKGTVTNVKQWLQTLDQAQSDPSVDVDGISRDTNSQEERNTLPHVDGLSISTTGEEDSPRTTLPYVPPKPRPVSSLPTGDSPVTARRASPSLSGSIRNGKAPGSAAALDSNTPAPAPLPTKIQTKPKPSPPPILAPKPIRAPAISKSTSLVQPPHTYDDGSGNDENRPSKSTRERTNHDGVTTAAPPSKITSNQPSTKPLPQKTQPSQPSHPPAQPPAPQTTKPTPPTPRRRHPQSPIQPPSPPPTNPSLHSTYRRLSIHPETPNMTPSSLANALVASTLATSTHPTPSTSPAPPTLPPRPAQPHLPFQRRSTPSTRSSSPNKKSASRYTMRNTHGTPGSSSENLGTHGGHHHHPFHRSTNNKSPPNKKGAEAPGTTRTSRPRIRKHPHKHHEASRKRYREEITPSERKRYEGVWAANRSLLLDRKPQQAERVHAIVVRDIYSRSRLPPATLQQIYDLIDNSRTGSLSREEFVVGLWLCDQRLKGRKVPVRVSERVWACVRGWGGVKVPKFP
ncbi:MAG: Increased rDNA silencing protein [Alyxoria varia]|nr:MAG: Increased rDNA silencing protein [Alyxoria varia]